MCSMFEQPQKVAYDFQTFQPFFLTLQVDYYEDRNFWPLFFKSNQFKFTVIVKYHLLIKNLNNLIFQVFYNLLSIIFLR